jgi:exopolysaccharide biosynthesis polyprenyl glycosylphosphotransferase
MMFILTKLISPARWNPRPADSKAVEQPRLLSVVNSIVRRNWRTCAAVSAMLIDTVILTTTFLAASAALYPASRIVDVLVLDAKLFAFLIAVFLISFTAVGIYRTVSYTPLKDHYLAATKAYIYSAAIVLSTLFLFSKSFYPRNFLAAFFLLLPVTYVAVWFATRRLFRWLRQAGYGRWNTIVLGHSKNINKLLERFREFPDLGYDTVKVMTVNNAADHKLHVNGPEVEKEIVSRNAEFMVLSSSDINGSYDDLERLCAKHYVRMRVVSPETDLLFKQVRIHDIAGLPLFSPNRQRIDGSKRIAKRLFDIVGSTLLLVVLSPVFLAVAIATKLESKGPVFFKQRRSLSDRDKPFMFYKFRSMHHEADEKKETLFNQNESTGALFKMKNDPRLTLVGKYIRRYSIDELPQLFNVLKGEMSLVGPRPLPVGDFKRLTEHNNVGGYFRARSKAKPGMTGLWQVSGRSHLGFQEMVMLDLYYIENQSLLFDVEILAQTVPVVLFGKGAY